MPVCSSLFSRDGNSSLIEAEDVSQPGVGGSAHNLQIATKDYAVRELIGALEPEGVGAVSP